MRVKLLLAPIIAALTISFLPTSVIAATSTTAAITVSGTGTVKVERDRATTQFGLAVSAKTSKEAQNGLKTRVASVRSSVLAAGAKAADLTTTSVSLYPEYDFAPNQRPMIIGYRASLSFSVTSAVEKASEFIDASLTAGGDDVTINGISFDASKARAAASTARTRAVADARLKAAEYAKAAGVRLGSVKSIVEVSAPSYSPIYAKASADAGLPLDAGTQDITATISVTFAIR